VKQITEIDDPRLVKALAHPLRIHILRVLQSRVASPSEIAEEVSAPLGNVSYHVRFLARVGLLELVDTRPRRGALEHYYKARGSVQITQKAWAQVPEIVKTAMVGSSLDQVVQDVSAAAAAGGFDHGEAVVNRRPLALDKQGFAELSAELSELLSRVSAIEADSQKRIASGGDERNGEISAGLVTLLFEAPRGGEAVAAEKPQRRARSRRSSSARSG
jgi:DNA-binding transcriptional ArsR family regulator